LLCNAGITQVTFTISELPPMPEPVANNAVTTAFCGDSLCVYSFCGIDATKTPAGIHLKAWRYNTVSEIWSQLPDVPDDTGNGKIAAGASTVNNKIYLIGGYYVEDNFSELSSDDVHVFNPETNSWEEDGEVIPVPIDDHVQAVWNGTHIYVVTGWSDVTNVTDVQIYHPETDTWSEGTSVPNNSDYRVFGGSGDIVGNTIFYHGGVRSGFNFFPTSDVRKGTINPEVPQEIEWELLGESELGDTYRAGAISIPFAHAVYWIGGSQLGYNFDGIDYNGSGGVAPADRIIGHNYFTPELMFEATVNNMTDDPLPMDLRGVARLSSLEDESAGNHLSMICGGMLADQEVTDKVFLISSDNATTVNEEEPIDFSFIISDDLLQFTASEKISQVELIDLMGRTLVIKGFKSTHGTIELQAIQNGIYFLRYTTISGEVQSSKKILLD